MESRFQFSIENYHPYFFYFRLDDCKTGSFEIEMFFLMNLNLTRYTLKCKNKFEMYESSLKDFKAKYQK
jgi:hypothetical protein